MHSFSYTVRLRQLRKQADREKICVVQKISVAKKSYSTAIADDHCSFEFLPCSDRDFVAHSPFPGLRIYVQPNTPILYNHSSAEAFTLVHQ